MAITNRNYRNEYVVPDSAQTTEFAYGFKITEASELRVTVDDVETASGFTVKGIGEDAGGVVEFDTAQTGKTIVLERVVDLTQPVDLRNQGEFFPEVIEGGFDKSRMIDQQQQREIDRLNENIGTVEESAEVLRDAFIRVRRDGQDIIFSSRTEMDAATLHDKPIALTENIYQYVDNADADSEKTLMADSMTFAYRADAELGNDDYGRIDTGSTLYSPPLGWNATPGLIPTGKNSADVTQLHRRVDIIFRGQSVTIILGKIDEASSAQHGITLDEIENKDSTVRRTLEAIFGDVGGDAQKSIRSADAALADRAAIYRLEFSRTGFGSIPGVAGDTPQLVAINGRSTIPAALADALEWNATGEWFVFKQATRNVVLRIAAFDANESTISPLVYTMIKNPHLLPEMGEELLSVAMEATRNGELELGDFRKGDTLAGSVGIVVTGDTQATLSSQTQNLGLSLEALPDVVPADFADIPSNAKGYAVEVAKDSEAADADAATVAADKAQVALDKAAVEAAEQRVLDADKRIGELHIPQDEVCVQVEGGGGGSIPTGMTEAVSETLTIESEGSIAGSSGNQYMPSSGITYPDLQNYETALFEIDADGNTGGTNVRPTIRLKADVSFTLTGTLTNLDSSATTIRAPSVNLEHRDKPSTGSVTRLHGENTPGSAASNLAAAGSAGDSATWTVSGTLTKGTYITSLAIWVDAASTSTSVRNTVTLELSGNAEESSGGSALTIAPVQVDVTRPADTYTYQRSADFPSKGSTSQGYNLLDDETSDFENDVVSFVKDADSTRAGGQERLIAKAETDVEATVVLENISDVTINFHHAQLFVNYRKAEGETQSRLHRLGATSDSLAPTESYTLAGTFTLPANGYIEGFSFYTDNAGSTAGKMLRLTGTAVMTQANAVVEKVTAECSRDISYGDKTIQGQDFSNILTWKNRPGTSEFSRPFFVQIPSGAQRVEPTTGATYSYDKDTKAVTADTTPANTVTYYDADNSKQTTTLLNADPAAVTGMEIWIIWGTGNADVEGAQALTFVTNFHNIGGQGARVLGVLTNYKELPDINRFNDGDFIRVGADAYIASNPDPSHPRSVSGIVRHRVNRAGQTVYGIISQGASNGPLGSWTHNRTVTRTIDSIEHNGPVIPKFELVETGGGTIRCRILIDKTVYEAKHGQAPTEGVSGSRMLVQVNSVPAFTLGYQPGDVTVDGIPYYDFSSELGISASLNLLDTIKKDWNNKEIHIRPYDGAATAVSGADQSILDNDAHWTLILPSKLQEALQDIDHLKMQIGNHGADDATLKELSDRIAALKRELEGDQSGDDVKFLADNNRITGLEETTRANRNLIDNNRNEISDLKREGPKSGGSPYHIDIIHYEGGQYPLAELTGGEVTIPSGTEGLMVSLIPETRSPELIIPGRRFDTLSHGTIVATEANRSANLKMTERVTHIFRDGDGNLLHQFTSVDFTSERVNRNAEAVLHMNDLTEPSRVRLGSAFTKPDGTPGSISQADLDNIHFSYKVDLRFTHDAGQNLTVKLAYNDIKVAFSQLRDLPLGAGDLEDVKTQADSNTSEISALKAEIAALKMGTGSGLSAVSSFPDTPSEGDSVILDTDTVRTRRLLATGNTYSGIQVLTAEQLATYSAALQRHIPTDKEILKVGEYEYKLYDTRAKQAFAGSVEVIDGWKYSFFATRNPEGTILFVRWRHSGNTTTIEAAIRENHARAIRAGEIALPLTDSTTKQLTDALTHSGRMQSFSPSDAAKTLASDANDDANAIRYDYRNYRVGSGVSFVGYLGRVNPHFTNMGPFGFLNPGREDGNDLLGHSVAALFWNALTSDSQGAGSLVHGQYAQGDFLMDPTSTSYNYGGIAYRLWRLSTTNFGAADGINGLNHDDTVLCEFVYNDDTVFATNAFATRVRVATTGGWERVHRADEVATLARLGAFDS